MKLGAINGQINANIWQVAYDSGELAAATTTVTISGLLGNTDNEYLLVCRFINAYNGNPEFRLLFNNDSGANYGTQFLVGTNTTAAASRESDVNDIKLNDGVALNNIGLTSVRIYAKSGYIRTGIVKMVRGVSTTTVTGVYTNGFSWNNTADEVTSLVITSDQANAIGIGSRIILLKRTAATTGQRAGDLNPQGKVTGAFQKIYSSILSSAATSVTISGLDGNTDVLYKLVVKTVNGYNGASYKVVYLNNDTTSANYGRQYLQGNNSTVGANRFTDTLPYITYEQALNEISLSETFIYAKSGYVRTAYSRFGSGMSSTTCNSMDMQVFSWNNTNDNITSIVITDSSGHANNLGIGTVIELYAYRP